MFFSGDVVGPGRNEEVANAVLPSQAAPGKKVRLPGQTRVSAEEYREFLGLGHGEIFNLDIDRWAVVNWG